MERCIFNWLKARIRSKLLRRTLVVVPILHSPLIGRNAFHQLLVFQVQKTKPQKMLPTAPFFM